jgi:hypothetical protein
VIHPDLAIKDLDYSGLVIQDLDFWGGRRAWLGCEEGKEKKEELKDTRLTNENDMGF